MGRSRAWLFVAIAACNGASDPTDVVVPPHCGDGILQPDEGEACDDSNAVSGDGCSSTCKREDGNHDGQPVIQASWDLLMVDGTDVGCLGPGDSARVIVTPLSSGGGPIVDNFPCADRVGQTAPLDDGDYRVRIEIRDASNGLFASALPETVSVVGTDVLVHAVIYVDGGYFTVAWHLQSMVTTMTETCAQADAAHVDVIATDGDSVQFRSSLACDLGAGLTVPLVEGDYVIGLEAISSTNKVVGSGSAGMKTIVAPNTVTDLGTATIVIGP